MFAYLINSNFKHSVLVLIRQFLPVIHRLVCSLYLAKFSSVVESFVDSKHNDGDCLSITRRVDGPLLDQEIKQKVEKIYRGREVLIVRKYLFTLR